MKNSKQFDWYFAYRYLVKLVSAYFKITLCARIVIIIRIILYFIKIKGIKIRKDYML